MLLNYAVRCQVHRSCSLGHLPPIRMGPEALFHRSFQLRPLPATNCGVEAAPRDYFSAAEGIIRLLLLVMFGLALLQLLGHLDDFPRQDLVAHLREVHVVPGRKF